MLLARSGIQAAVVDSGVAVFGGGVHASGASFIEQMRWESVALFAEEQSMANLAGGFRREVLASGLSNPVDMAISERGEVFVVERQGAVRLLDSVSGELRNVLDIEVFFEFEDGLLGIALAPDFSSSGQLYLYYSVADKSVNRLSRFEFTEGQIQKSSELMLLEVPVQREECCHAAGDMVFDRSGNLLLATGDNAFHSLHGAIDEEVSYKSAEQSSSNTMDLRGKILRIKPHRDGSYSIPAGNLFPGGKDGRPEIYLMGARSPFKLSVDPDTDWLFWADVGPDAKKQDGRNPIGLDEINLSSEAGNYGWPYLIGANEAYWDAQRQIHHKADSPINESKWNTGVKALPAAQPAWISQPAQCLLTGPVYRFDPSVENPGKLPPEFDGSLFYFDFNKSKIWTAKLGEQGQALSVQRFAPYVAGDGFIDMQLGPDHQLYVLEYGYGCCPLASENGRLSRLAYDPQYTEYVSGWRAFQIDSKLPWRSISVLAADLNKDSFTDIVTGGAWYQNPGRIDGKWTRRLIGAPLHNVILAMDIEEGNFTVYGNLPHRKPVHMQPFVTGAAVGDFLSDGKLQIALSYNGGEQRLSAVDLLVPYRRPGKSSLAMLHPNSLGASLSAADIDGDGDLDLTQGPTWLENRGEGKWMQHWIDPNASLPGSNVIADVNGDGRLDVILGFQSPVEPIVWYENRDAANDWRRHVITGGTAGGLSIDAKDFDYDGDIDVAVGEHTGEKRLILYENDGTGETWFPQIVNDGSAGIDHRNGSLGADLDNDGDLDIISIGWRKPELWIYENPARALE
jgi:glucose/arabinose dehydrogenase